MSVTPGISKVSNVADDAAPMFGLHEIVMQGAMEDGEEWVPIGDGIFSRPLCFNVSEGYWVHLLKATRAGFINRHRHPGPVHILTLKGKWRYPERDWVGTPGTYVFEAPGDVHTLTVPEDGVQMVFLSIVKGALLYLDSRGELTGYDDVFTRIAAAERHYRELGRNPEAIRRLIR